MRLLPLLFLTGCAIAPTQMTSMPDSRICYLWVAGGPQTSANAYKELQRRQYKCTDQDLQYARAQQQNDQANAALGTTLLLNSRPPAPAIAPPAPQRNCTTQVVNGVAYTSCN